MEHPCPAHGVGTDAPPALALLSATTMLSSLARNVPMGDGDDALLDGTLPEHVATALLCRLVGSPDVGRHVSFCSDLAGVYPDAYQLAVDLHGDRPVSLPTTVRGSISRSRASGPVLELFRDIRSRAPIGRERMAALLTGFTEGSVTPSTMASVLTGLSMYGMCTEDTLSMTCLLRDSGRVYDYRGALHDPATQLVRRYPTGGVSEKGALILPAMISAVRTQYRVATPFMVARSLGFTGGTWDKLRSIEGFTFPRPGSECISALNTCGVAMCVAHQDVAPLDTSLYEFRSATGTVDVPGLMIASIAAKQLAVPVDHFLLDVRYGEGAFLKTAHDASVLADGVCAAVGSIGTSTASVFTAADTPGGAAIGNLVEVAEACCVLTGRASPRWDQRALDKQRNQVIRLFSLLMTMACADAATDWQSLGFALLDNGRACDAFGRIAVAHGVSAAAAGRLLASPDEALDSLPRCIVRADRTGRVLAVHQRALGLIVNFGLGAGGSRYAAPYVPSAGVILSRQIGDPVHIGDQLAEVYGIDTADHPVAQQVASCICLSDDG